MYESTNKKPKEVERKSNFFTSKTKKISIKAVVWAFIIVLLVCFGIYLLLILLILLINGNPYPLFLFGYVVFALCLQIIAEKTGNNNGWFAWIPTLNCYLMCKIAGKPIWFWFFFIPIVNLVIYVLIWERIALKRGINSANALDIGIVMLIPFINFIPLVLLAMNPRFLDRCITKLDRD